MHPTAQFRPWQFEPTAIDPRLETLRRIVEAADELQMWNPARSDVPPTPPPASLLGPWQSAPLHDPLKVLA
jgi:hypothetical protein